MSKGIKNNSKFLLAIILMAVLFFGGKYLAIPEEEVNHRDFRKPVKDYLEENIGNSGFGGEVFCAYEILGEEKLGILVNEYLWVMCQEFYLKEGNLKEGTGSSLPVAFVLQEEGDSYKVIDCKIPQSGAEYGQDIREIFPEEYHAKIFPQPPDYLEYNQRAERLHDEVKKEAELYLK